jgi:hypothetical protein
MNLFYIMSSKRKYNINSVTILTVHDSVLKRL